VLFYYNFKKSTQRIVKEEKQERKTEDSEINSEQSSNQNDKKKEHRHKRHGSPSNYICKLSYTFFFF